MSSQRFLLVTWEGGGVIPPELGLARRLIQRGHRVHVLADPTVEAEALAAGCTFTPWSTAPHVVSRRPEDLIVRDWEFSNPLKMMGAYLQEFLADPAPRWAADVDEVLASETYDAALVDFAVPAAMIPLEARGIPVIGVMPNCWMLPAKGIPPFGPGFAPSSNPLARVRDAAMRAMTTRMFDRALPAINATRADFGLPPASSTAAQMLTGRTLVLTSPVFDFTSPHQPATAIYAGPILDDPSWAEPWESPWASDDARPLVVVGLSSGFQDQAGVLDRVADALASVPVRGLITLGTFIDADEVSPRSGAGDVVVRQHVPHAQVFAHAAAVVTHCGHGTTMKALTAGLPMVCLPMGRDQNDTAARVAFHRAGVRLKPTAPAARIAAAVADVLHDPRYRDAADRLGRRIVAGEGCADPIAVIEAAARDGRAVEDPPSQRLGRRPPTP